MMAMIFVLVLPILTINIISGQQIYPFLGECPKVEVMKNFNTEKFLGKWYEQEKYPIFLEMEGKCTTYQYTTNANSTIKVAMHQVSTITKKPNNFEGDIKLDNKTGEAKLIMGIPSMNIDVPYWVLDTDYKEYAVVWSCIQEGKFSVRFCWILTRKNTSRKEIMERAYDVLKKQNISRRPIEKTSQKNCKAN
ncbi:apolipoprotein D isoform X1 [Leptinotarsa decemlineata]|uniref:apolipoprotein D isoform X1 n=1 Tax=Leptinotarsa decemlineata TaxID=7539 RepID=UPI003D308725